MKNVSEKVLYPDLSYKIIGMAFKVFNEIGYGMAEKYYQQVFTKELEQEKLVFEKEKYVPLTYNHQPIGKYFLDFIIDDKVVVELKVRPHLGYVHVRQVMGYLKTIERKLAIIIYFTRDGVKYRRIVNAT